MTGASLRALALAGMLLCPPAALAQLPGEESAAPPAGFLDAKHWAVEAAWRANALGLAPAFLPAQGLVSPTMVEAALRTAAREAEARPPGIRALAAGWYARFAEEFPGLTDTAEEGAAPFRLASGALAIGAVSHTGRVEPGRGEFPGQIGSEALPDLEGVVASAAATVSVGTHLSLQLAPRFDARELSLAVADLTVAAGPWSASLGRQAVGYGWARGGGVVLSGNESIDRFELATRRPIRLAGLLSVLGPMAFHTFFSRLTDERHTREPYLWGARGVWRPHPRLDLAIQRASMFGGEGEPLSARRVALMLIGRVVSRGFENQIVSAAGRFRLPSESLLPLTAFAEWGAEDAAGAWRDAPGYVVGIEAPALPVAPELSLGVEFASFAASCCGNPPWYRHSALTGGWAGRNETLGHPLGGSGTQLLGRAGADLLDARLRLDATVFRRDRREENLFVPGRAGRSTGLSADVAWRVVPRSELWLSAAREDGDGWRESALRAGGTLFLGN
jgi:hypothetical protein